MQSWIDFHIKGYKKMANILLVEPDYHSKFPPLGLMKLSTFHKSKGDTVTFTRGKDSGLRSVSWHRIYISSLFTWELPRTVQTIKYYGSSVDNPKDIIVGGIGATLMPNYIRENIDCTIIEGTLDKPGPLGNELNCVASLIPDYSLLDDQDYSYEPKDSYFCRATIGCIRKCKFCAVPILEPNFGYAQSIAEQIEAIDQTHGQKQNLVLLDNNILAVNNFVEIITEIKEQGFARGATRNSKQRTVDFNQGIDARLINKKTAKALSSICLSPIRLAFDYDGIEKAYRRAIKLLSDQGFIEFTNYIMYNFDDTPESFYHRLRVNLELRDELGVRVTGFPMKYIPINSTTRGHVSKGWYWRYLRGIQCVLQATHGMVSPNPSFFEAAFGNSVEEFKEIISMPDRYIMFRNKYKNDEAAEWRKLFIKLSTSEKNEFLTLLERIKNSRNKTDIINSHYQYKDLLQHYYPNGQVPKPN